MKGRGTQWDSKSDDTCKKSTPLDLSCLPYFHVIPISLLSKVSVCVSVCWVAESCPTLCDPMNYNLPGSSCPWNFSGKNTGVGCHFPPPGDLPNPGIEPVSPESPARHADSSRAKPSGKPKGTAGKQQSWNIASLSVRLTPLPTIQHSVS